MNTQKAKSCAIIGPAGTGKTTLLEAFFADLASVDLSRNPSELGLRVPKTAVYSGVNEDLRGKSAMGDFVTSLIKIEEQVRLLCQERAYASVYDIPEGAVHQFRFDLLDKQIAAENQAISKGLSFISDRSVIDNWAYFVRWSWNHVSVESAEDYYQRARAQAQNYDLIIYVPIMFPAQDDGFRWANDTYQAQMDRLLRSTLHEWGLGEKVYEIKSAEPKTRLEELRDSIQSAFLGLPASLRKRISDS